MMELTMIKFFFLSKDVNRTVVKFGYKVCNSMFELVLFKALPCMITTSSFSDFVYCILSTIFKFLYYIFEILIFIKASQHIRTVYIRQFFSSDPSKQSCWLSHLNMASIQSPLSHWYWPVRHVFGTFPTINKIKKSVLKVLGYAFK